MKTLFSYLVYFRTELLCIIVVSFASLSSWAKTTDMGVCFLKTDKQTIQSKINEIAVDGQQNMRIQQQVRFFNDLTNLFVPVDTFNYKMFWIQTPNNDWLAKNCFKFGYITLMDYNRRAITRVYSSPAHMMASSNGGSRMPASTKAAIPLADPPAGDGYQQSYAETPFDPQAQSYLNTNEPPPAQNPQSNYAAPQINLYNYYSGAKPNTDEESSQTKSKKDVTEDTEASKKEENLNVNVNVSETSKDASGKNKKELDLEEGLDDSKTVSVYELPSYYNKPSYFLELSPLMGYETTTVEGSGAKNKFGIFGYGADIKFGYRSSQYFNYYLKGRYMNLELRSVDAPATVELAKNTDYSYGIGIEHVASRFLSLALEYNILTMQSFQQVGVLTNSQNVEENFQTINLDFKLNFISRDDFKFGLHGNYGIVHADNSDELIYDFKTKFYLLRVFEKDYFGLNFGYEQNKFLYASGPTNETTRKRYVFGLNFGFDL